jgi:subtilase family serine protease
MIVNSFPAEDHRIVAVVDSNNNIAEENEGNNTFLGTAYRLRRAGCP